VTCTPAGAVSVAVGASCKATLTTTLSQFIPVATPRPRLRIPEARLWIGVWLVILLLALAQHAARLQKRWPRVRRRLGYAAAGLLLFACLTAGFAGCSGSSGSGSNGGKAHTDSITAVYSGDTNYTGSTSAALSVTVQ
jgi:hypothetical protein